MIERMKIQILELVDRQAMILSEADREYILGLHMLLEMEENIDAQHAPRVAEIYNKVVAIY